MPVPRMLVALVSLCALSCAPQSAEQPVEVSVEARAIRVPFDEYTLSTLDIHLIEYAEDVYTRECMRRTGMHWEMLPPPSRQDPAPMNRKRYGLIEPEVAARYGYHLPPPPRELAEREAIWSRREKLAGDEKHSAYGDSGCSSEARTRLREDLPVYDQSLLNDYASEAFATARKEPDVVAAFQQWSACMRTGGFTYTAPFDANDDPAWQQTARPSAHEIAVAQADVRCKKETGLVARWSAAEAGAQLAVIQAHPADFDGFRRAKNAELDAARRTLG